MPNQPLSSSVEFCEWASPCSSFPASTETVLQLWPYALSSHNHAVNVPPLIGLLPALFFPASTETACSQFFQPCSECSSIEFCDWASPCSIFSLLYFSLPPLRLHARSSSNHAVNVPPLSSVSGLLSLLCFSLPTLRHADCSPYQ